MNVLLVSQCSKNALTETRRILDQFAERRGDRTWQTAITQQGLETLRRLLRQTARKNTAVACHWIRGKDHSELLWVVGNARQFNEHGATPTNITERDVLRAGDENDWHTAETIRLLAAMAALFHDVGKASEAFQKKLTSKQAIADAYRHEWVSLRLFEAFVGEDKSDAEWLSRLAALAEQPGNLMGVICDRLLCDGLTDRSLRSPFNARPKPMPQLAQLVGWLIVSHHRMPTQWGEPFNKGILEKLLANITAGWCGSRTEANTMERQACWKFKAFPLDSREWRRRASYTAQAILKHPNLANSGAGLLDNPYVVHLSRLALMLADHYYSSQPSHERYGDTVTKASKPLYANSHWVDGKMMPKQRLDEHLIGVEINARKIVRSLPNLTEQLPRIAHYKDLRKPTKNARYRWQNNAFNLAEGICRRSEAQGFFGVNMASTGYGKTIANGRIIYALADPQLGARFTIALGLRTLTLQTGDVYRDELKLGSEVLAVMVGGGSAIRELHDMHKDKESKQAQAGTESSADLLPEGQGYVHFDGSLEDGPLNRWLEGDPQDRQKFRRNINAQKLLNAPVLVCTIDHFMPACESLRGGHQIAPMLRLMTSDLVLDEPDDFDTDDLPALARLVNWAGMLGSRVLLSSATLPPALVEGLFEAYRVGRQVYHANRGIPGQPVNVCCAWFDEFEAAASDHATPDNFAQAHSAFVAKRLAKLAAQENRRRAEIRALPIVPDKRRAGLAAEFAKHFLEQAHTYHALHRSEPDPQSGKRVSIGLIRMAHIDPLVETAKAIYAQGGNDRHHIHLCVYHSRHPLLVRSGIENCLDHLLNRKPENQNPLALFDKPQLRTLLEASPEPDHIVIVLATAVAEVGRDHDYDWAIVEPSSVRSIIQLAGRVRRHRVGECVHPNLCLLETNLSHLENPGKPAFCHPGFESQDFRLNSHLLPELLTSEQLARIDASSRICERPVLQPKDNLADLEHDRLRDLMQKGETPVRLWWNKPAHLCGELQRHQPFRNDPEGSRRFVLLPDDNGKVQFYRLEEPGEPPTNQTNLFHIKNDEKLAPGPRVSFFGEPDYQAALENLAENREMELEDCARRFGVIDLPGRDGNEEWDYHPALGFTRHS
jgi:CRISPR-associated endonuclease/helicase Cas3